MRVALIILTIALSVKVAGAAHATVNELQEHRADAFCQVHEQYCDGN
jgi:hypothetical protein